MTIRTCHDLQKFANENNQQEFWCEFYPIKKAEEVDAKYKPSNGWYSAMKLHCTLQDEKIKGKLFANVYDDKWDADPLQSGYHLACIQ